MLFYNQSEIAAVLACFIFFIAKVWAPWGKENQHGKQYGMCKN